MINICLSLFYIFCVNAYLSNRQGSFEPILTYLEDEYLDVVHLIALGQ